MQARQRGTRVLGNHDCPLHPRPCINVTVRRRCTQKRLVSHLSVLVHACVCCAVKRACRVTQTDACTRVRRKITRAERKACGPRYLPTYPAVCPPRSEHMATNTSTYEAQSIVADTRPPESNQALSHVMWSVCGLCRIMPSLGAQLLLSALLCSPAGGETSSPRSN